jgi:hypothetical protein
MTPEAVHILIPRIFEYGTLRGQRDFADVARYPEMRTLLWIIWGSLNHTSPFRGGRQENQRRLLTTEAEVRVVTLEKGALAPVF